MNTDRDEAYSLLKYSFRVICVHLCSSVAKSELLERVTRRRHQSAVAARRQHDLGDVEVAARVGADVVRREEIPRSARVLPAPPACEQSAVVVEHAHAPSGSVGGGGRSGPHPRFIAQLGHEDVVGSVDEHLTGPGDIGPLGEVLSLEREELDAAVLAVGDKVLVAELGYCAGMWPGTTAPSDTTGGRVSVFDRDGRLIARWGGGRNPCAAGDFFAPHDICADSRGDLYVAEVVLSAGGNGKLVSTDCHSLQKFKTNHG